MKRLFKAVKTSMKKVKVDLIKVADEYLILLINIDSHNGMVAFPKGNHKVTIKS